MRKLNKLLTSTLAALALSTASVQADSSGWSVGVIQNFADFTTIGQENEPGKIVLSASATNNETTKATHSKSVEFPSIFLEYSGRPDSGSPLASTFGVSYIPGEASIGSKSRTDTAATVGADANSDGTYTAKAELSNHLSIYLEPTLMMGNDVFGFYGKLGASGAQVKTLERLAVGTAGDSSTSDEAMVFGGTVGAGVKAVFGNGILIKGEWTDTQYNEVELRSPTGNQNTIIATPEVQMFRVSLGYNF